MIYYFFYILYRKINKKMLLLEITINHFALYHSIGHNYGNCTNKKRNNARDDYLCHLNDIVGASRSLYWLQSRWISRWDLIRRRLMY